MQQLIPGNVQRGLSFLFALNVGDVYPAAEHVDAFVYAEVPRSAIHHYLQDDQYDDFAGIEGGDSVVEYLLTTGLAIAHGGGISLTKAGRALAARGDTGIASDGTAAALQVVGRFEDPITYAKFLTEVDKQESALVVDPYLPPDALFALIELPGVKRVLTRDTAIKGHEQQARRRQLAIAIGVKPEFELRFLPPEVKELHDRYVLPEHSGEGLMIGTSLGGTQVTVVTHLSGDTTKVLRKHYDALWDAASPLEPIARVSADS
jgi:hypothetical protein